MKLDQTIDRTISKVLIAKQEEEKANRKSSGKLSASILGYPVLWQILKVLGVPDKKFDEYTLRKFLRGNHVEEWIVNNMTGIVERQKFVEYKDCIGFVDVLVDTKDYEFKLGIIPHEVKSVTNFKFKRIEKSGEADPQHKLQACFYAMALKSNHYAIDYVASDDYRIRSCIYEVNSTVKEVDQIIDTFQQTLKSKKLPKFTPRYDWQNKPDYQNYVEWNTLDEAGLMTKLEKEYPLQFKQFTI